MRGLDGRVVVVVTGAADEVGETIVRAFVAAEASVAVVGEDGALLAAAVGEEVTHVSCDITAPGALESAFDEVLDRLGGFDVLVNTAATERWGPILEQEDDDFMAALHVNLAGTFLGIKYGGRIMQQRSGGAIVNVASTAGLTGIPALGALCASKAGVLRLTEVAAIELQEAGIRVNAVLPGFVTTGDGPTSGARRRGDPRHVARRVPAGRPRPLGNAGVGRARRRLARLRSSGLHDGRRADAGQPDALRRPLTHAGALRALDRTLMGRTSKFRQRVCAAHTNRPEPGVVG